MRCAHTTPGEGCFPKTLPRMLPAGSVITEYKALAVDLKDKNFYDHCFVAVHVMNMWPWWEVKPQVPGNMPERSTVESALLDLLPVKLVDMAVHLSNWPSFFEEYDLVCPWLEYYAHSPVPNCGLRVHPCTKCQHHVVKVIALKDIAVTDKLTLLHAPQDLLGNWTLADRPVHYMPQVLDVPPDDGSEAAALLSGKISPEMLRSVALVVRHAHKACKSAAYGHAFTACQLFLHLLGSKADIVMVRKPFPMLRNRKLSRIQRLKIQKFSGQCLSLDNDPAFWEAVAPLCSKFKSNKLFCEALRVFVDKCK